MLKRIEKFLQSFTTEKTNHNWSEQDIQLAKAALLIEVASIDQEFDHSEQQKLRKILERMDGLHHDDLEELINRGQQASSNATSLYQFTQIINGCLEYAEKKQLLEDLWHMAFADGKLDSYEEHIIRRTADLIHVRHSDFILSKQSAKRKSDSPK